MKKTIIVIIVLVIIGGLVWKFKGSDSIVDNSNGVTATSTPIIPTSQTVKVSEKNSEYKNDELGFSFKYPTNWEKSELPASISFFIPTAGTVKNTIGTLGAKAEVISAKCSFPPVTTVSERDTLKVEDRTFNMITLTNTVQGRSYFNRMYSLQKDSVCYFFTFTSITLSPTSKGYTGAEAQKIGAQNKTLIDTADTQFKDLVKSFKFVVGPAGQEESKVSPKK